MCGIGGFILTASDDRTGNIATERMLDTLLQAIDHRGGDACGFVARNRTGEIEWQKAAVDATPFLTYRRGMPDRTTVALAHTRMATQGLPGFPENNHPLRRGSFYVIHNGHVRNDAALFQVAGRDRFGQVDSESIAAVLSHVGSLAPSENLTNHLAKVEGAAAIAALDERDGTVLLARLTSSPLHVLRTRRAVLFASTEGAVRLAHESGIGSLSRRNRIEGWDEGQAATIHPDGTLEPFSVPVPVRAPVVTHWRPWTNERYPAATSVKWDKWEESLVDTERPVTVLSEGTERCAMCDSLVSDLDIVWSADVDEGYLPLCDGCAVQWESWGRPSGART